MSLSRRIFAADDWGLTPATNAGILELANKGLLHSVSIMANAPFVSSQLPELLNCRAKIGRFSLHLNFTFGRPLSPPGEVPSLLEKSGEFLSHRRLMFKCLGRKIIAGHVIQEFGRQLDHLLELGVPIEGVDGHHHVHLLPGIAAPLQQAMIQRGLAHIRVMEDSHHRASFLQTKLFKYFLAEKNFELEPCHYLLQHDLETADQFNRKLQRAGGRPLLVHPALYNDFFENNVSDPLQEKRVWELQSVLRYLNE